MKRRDFVKLTGIAGAVLLADKRLLASSTGQTPVPGADVIINLRAVVSEIALLPGDPTEIWTYEGEVVQGTSQNLQGIPNSFLGPTLRVRRGQTIRINFTNNLPEVTLLHWHGLHVPEEMDAHPRFMVQPGAGYVYEFVVMNRAGTYWYHPHPDMLTGVQVHRGLAGLFIVTDDEEQALGLPSGELDLPMVLQDRTFDSGNQFNYQHSMMVGFLGDRIVVNGNVARTIDVDSRYYRLRFLNGSNSRIYKLSWSDGTPMTAIATDGGLLEAPLQRPYLMLAPGERIEVIADFKSFPSNMKRRLVSQAFSPMGNVGSGGAAVSNGAALPIMTFRVRRRVPDNFVLPKRLSTINRYRIEDAINAATPRALPVTFQMGMFHLNGRMFEMKEVAPNEIVTINTLEAWDIANQSSTIQMAHPMHIHLVQFQIIERQINPAGAANFEGVRYGFLDSGWKDTFMLMPGERVRLLLRFEDYTGKFVYHCHNLEHEDMGMMRNFQVNAATNEAPVLKR